MAAADGERKTVTALFADIKGSMDLIEDLDPEEARAIVDPALNLMIDAVHRYDGYVVQCTGDGVFALFGAPVAHEEHPQRALYAALRIQEEMRHYSAGLRTAGKLPIEARVGANTGEVVVRSIATGGSHPEYAPIGHSTSLAARMQALAPAGSVAITATTRNLCEGFFSFRSLGPTKVKGVQDPVEIFEVTGLGPLRTRLQLAAGRGLSKFVGREQEMDALRLAADRAWRGHGQIVATMAEAGLGKSRLFYEFKLISHLRWLVLEAFSVPHGKSSAYLPLIDLLRNYFRIGIEDNEASRRAKIIAAALALDRSLQDEIPYLFALMGVAETETTLAMDPRIKRERTFEAITSIILRESINQPVLLIFEDIHWLDEETEALLSLLMDGIANASVLILVSYRPEYSDKWSNKTYYTRLRLDPLGQENAEEMLSTRLGHGEQLAELRGLVVSRTQGNPFFMEEMVQMLFEQGVLGWQGAVQLLKPIGDVTVPPTVQSVLASRIDRLPAAEKDLLQILAVIGKQFQVSLVKQIVSEPPDELNRMLRDLQLAEFLYEQPAPSEIEYAFKHALTQEVAYNSLLIRRRRILHERIGQAIEALYAGHLDDHLSDLARHYRFSDNAPKAIEYLHRASRQSTARSAYDDAIMSLQQGLALLDHLPAGPERQRDELELSTLLLLALQGSRGYAAPEVERLVARIERLSAEGADPALLFKVLYRSSTFYFVRGDLRRTRRMGEELVRRAETIADPDMLCMAHELLGGALVWWGDTALARLHLEKASSRSYRVALAYLGWAQWHLGYPDQARASVDRATQSTEKISRPYTVATVLGVVGLAYYLLHEYSRMLELAEALRIVSRDHGIAYYQALAAVHSGAALAGLGKTREGIARLTEGIGDFTATGTRLVLPYCKLALSEALLKAGQPELALPAINEALALVEHNGERYLEAELHRVKGEALLSLPQSEQTAAALSLERAVAVARDQSAKSMELRAATSLAQLLSRQGRGADALIMLTGISAWFTEGFNTDDMKRAVALSEEIALQCQAQ